MMVSRVAGSWLNQIPEFSRTCPLPLSINGLLNCCSSELLKTLGVPLIVDDLYSLDADSLTALQPIHALIFLFKWIPGTSDGATVSTGGVYDTNFPGFFAHQVVNNACATLAVMNALGNIPSLPSGPQLTGLINFTNGMDPQTRGFVITSADWLREAHNSLSPPSAISLDGLGLPRKSEDAYHFVVYLPITGSLYELDGLKEYAVQHGPFAETGEGWLTKARFVLPNQILWTQISQGDREVIEARIGTYPPGAVCYTFFPVFNLPFVNFVFSWSSVFSHSEMTLCPSTTLNCKNVKVWEIQEKRLRLWMQSQMKMRNAKDGRWVNCANRCSGCNDLLF